MSKQFFSNCSEIMRSEDKNLKAKAFERICETTIDLSLELENISKQLRALEVLKPDFKEDAVLKTELIRIFELAAEPSTPDDATRFRKYIRLVYKMACLEILPMECISVILKYFDTNYDTCGKLIEKILIEIHATNRNWIPQLIVHTISITYERLVEKHGVVDFRSHGAKVVLSLSRRFHALKRIMSPNITGKLLVYAINYALMRKTYDFLIYVRPFTDEVRQFPANCKEILKVLEEKLPQSDRKNESILYFAQHLRSRAVPQPVRKSGEVTKKVRGKTKGKKLFKKTQSQSTSESGASESISIHDTSSDDIELAKKNSE